MERRGQDQIRRAEDVCVRVSVIVIVNLESGEGAGVRSKQSLGTQKEHSREQAGM